MKYKKIRNFNHKYSSELFSFPEHFKNCIKNSKKKCEKKEFKKKEKELIEKQNES